ncbi:MAG TPA: LLM class flavin-dependent oxidoreductase [Gemmatimonadaceae bacterium]|nr:LLM class flavin-dependent oxidoreductase [Gemmatimonadaceae bacterium]
MILSVLDQSPISEGSTGGDALRNSIDLAQFTEALGYNRYWIAEHHATPMLASPSPEALIGPIAALTSRIRVGSGGVMLPHYSPLKVAETFSMFAGLFPGRIDLGIGRAPGTDQLAMFALQRDRRQAAPDDFPEQLGEMLGYLENDLPPDHPFADVAQLPGRPEAPDVWMLGSSPQSAIWAGELGLPYVFADFINPDGARIAELYRERFTPSARLREPRLMVATWALCADSNEEAETLASSSRMAFSLLRTTGKTIPVPTVEKALHFLKQEAAGLPMARRRRVTLGTPEVVRDGLESIVREYGAEELMIVTITHSHEVRRHSYELIAEAFEVATPTSPPAKATDAGQGARIA